jgi:hypothetical protein
MFDSVSQFRDFLSAFQAFGASGQPMLHRQKMPIDAEMQHCVIDAAISGAAERRARVRAAANRPA